MEGRGLRGQHEDDHAKKAEEKEEEDKQFQCIGKCRLAGIFFLLKNLNVNNCRGFARHNKMLLRAANPIPQGVKWSQKVLSMKGEAVCVSLEMHTLLEKHKTVKIEDSNHENEHHKIKKKKNHGKV